MSSQWKITQEAKILPKLHNPLFIEGLPGIGNVGKIVVDFLIEELKAQKLYSFFSYKFPHSVFIGEDNLVQMPKLEIYYKKCSGKKRDILLLTGDIQPIDEESCFTFCEAVLQIAKQFKCSEMITTGGIGLQQIPEKPKVYCTGNNISLFKQYTKNGTGVQKEIYGIVGPVIGVSGVLLGLGQKRNVRGVALLAETFAHPMFLGVKGAQEIIRVFEKKFSYGFNLQKMSKDIINAEKELMKKSKEWMAEMAAPTQAGAKIRQKEAGYIG